LPSDIQDIDIPEQVFVPLIRFGLSL